MEVITTLSENIKEQSCVTAETIAEGKSFSEVLKGSKVTDFRKIMQEARNDERIEEREKERRSKNARKEHDAKMIDNFLETVGVASKPLSNTRLGKLNQENQKRTVKVVMRTNIDTEYVMRDLK